MYFTIINRNSKIGDEIAQTILSCWDILVLSVCYNSNLTELFVYFYGNKEHHIIVCILITLNKGKRKRQDNSLIKTHTRTIIISFTQMCPTRFPSSHPGLRADRDRCLQWDPAAFSLGQKMSLS